MKFYMRKIVAIGLVAVLVSLAGWFCANPMNMRAMENASDMEMSATLANANHSMNGVLHNVFNACVAGNCLSKFSEMLVAKKFNFDLSVNFLANVFDNKNSNILAFSSEADPFFKTRPPAPDLLSSVFKKE